MLVNNGPHVTNAEDEQRGWPVLMFGPENGQSGNRHIMKVPISKAIRIIAGVTIGPETERLIRLATEIRQKHIILSLEYRIRNNQRVGINAALTDSDIGTGVKAGRHARRGMSRGPSEKTSP